MLFAETGLDPRLLRGLSKRGFTAPTAVQAAAIPRTLEGKDVVARARTGSGKTLAYLLPALHRILVANAGGTAGAEAAAATAAASSSSFKAIVLVPTRELCEQVKVEAATMAQHCGTEITATSLTGETPQQLKRAIAGAGQVVVATPGRLAAALREGFLSPASLGARLQTLVLDEADLLLSYGYEEDLQLIAPHIPRSCQVLLMSATSSEDVERLQKLVLHNPVTLNLLHLGGQTSAAAPNTGRGGTTGVSADIEHFAATMPAADRLLYLMAMLKLGLVRRKALIFVNTVDEGFRVKLFLESFGVRSALLNAELPLNSRSHILATFNKGLFDYLIATDDVHAHTHDSKSIPGGKGSGGFKQRAAKATAAKRGSGRAKDEEFGVTRGIDFKGVRTIINYDVPSSVEGYVHRVGRTGRAGEAGTAVSFFTPADVLFESELQTALSGVEAAPTPISSQAGMQQSIPGAALDALDEEGLEEAAAAVQATQVLKPFTRLPASQVEALRYRGEDLARSITKGVIKEARARELRLELLNSDKLKDYFEEHAAEKMLLRHDKALHKAPQPAHLKHIPAYIRDATLISVSSAPGNSGKGALSHKKRKRIDSGQDPLKAGDASAFVRAPKKGGAANEQLTELEMRAEAVGKKEARKRAKNEVLPVYKSNVKKTTNNFRRR